MNTRTYLLSLPYLQTCPRDSRVSHLQPPCMSFPWGGCSEDLEIIQKERIRVTERRPVLCHYPITVALISELDNCYLLIIFPLQILRGIKTFSGKNWFVWCEVKNGQSGFSYKDVFLSQKRRLLNWRKMFLCARIECAVVWFGFFFLLIGF